MCCTHSASGLLHRPPPSSTTHKYILIQSNPQHPTPLSPAPIPGPGDTDKPRRGGGGTKNSLLGLELLGGQGCRCLWYICMYKVPDGAVLGAVPRAMYMQAQTQTTRYTQLHRVAASPHPACDLHALPGLYMCLCASRKRQYQLLVPREPLMGVSCTRYPGSWRSWSPGPWLAPSNSPALLLAHGESQESFQHTKKARDRGLKSIQWMDRLSRCALPTDTDHMPAWTWQT